MTGPDEGGHAVMHSKWHHWVDSRTPDAEEVTDEGDMYPIEGGERALEKGRMVNPATGILTDYEELWQDVKPTATSSEVDGEEEGKRFCVVLQLDEPKEQARGMIVRVGQHCQGVLRCRNTFSLERWGWQGDADGWKRTCRIGDYFVPCSAAFDESKVKLGGWVRYGDFGWKVVELSHF